MFICNFKDRRSRPVQNGFTCQSYWISNVFLGGIEYTLCIYLHRFLNKLALKTFIGEPLYWNEHTLMAELKCKRTERKRNQWHAFVQFRIGKVFPYFVEQKSCNAFRFTFISKTWTWIHANLHLIKRNIVRLYNGDFITIKINTLFLPICVKFNKTHKDLMTFQWFNQNCLISWLYVLFVWGGTKNSRTWFKVNVRENMWHKIVTLSLRQPCLILERSFNRL